MGDQSFDDRLEFPVRHVFLGHEAATVGVGLDRARAPAKLRRESSVLRITSAGIRVNIDWARLWK